MSEKNNKKNSSIISYRPRTKIKYEVSKPSYLIPFNPEKFLKTVQQKSLTPTRESLLSPPHNISKESHNLNNNLKNSNKDKKLIQLSKNKKKDVLNKKNSNNKKSIIHVRVRSEIPHSTLKEKFITNNTTFKLDRSVNFYQLSNNSLNNTMSEYSKNNYLSNKNNNHCYSALFHYEKDNNKLKFIELEKEKFKNENKIIYTNNFKEYQKSVSERKLQLLGNLNNLSHNKRNINQLNNISLTLDYKKRKSPTPKKMRNTLSPTINDSITNGKNINNMNNKIINKENKESQEKNRQKKKNIYKEINTSPFLKAKQPAKSNRIFDNTLNTSKIDKKKYNLNNKQLQIQNIKNPKNIINPTFKFSEKNFEESKIKKNSMTFHTTSNHNFQNNTTTNNINNNKKQSSKKKTKSNSLKKESSMTIKEKSYEKEERIITPLKASLSTRGNKNQENPIKKKSIIYTNNISQSSILSINNNNIISNPKIIKEIKKINSLCKKGFLGSGTSKINQDNYFIYKSFTENPNILYIGVCDGHGILGHEVSLYLINNLPNELNNIFLQKRINNIDKTPIEKLNPIIEKTFKIINQKIINNPKIETSFSGSTCCSLIITPNKLLCANVGDSRAIIGKKIKENFWISKEISHDHKPNEKEEKKRIILNGGRVESYKDENGNLIGPERVWKEKEDIPGLAMSRSFGDEIAHSVGVICVPEICQVEFEEEDKFLIVASDGIWEFISSDEAVDILKDFYLSDDIYAGTQFLYKEARKRWIVEEDVVDDITLIVVFFK